MQPTRTKTVLENTTAKKKKRKKTEHKMMIKRGKMEKTAETKCKSKGRSYSAPKPVWELLLVRQLQIILGEKLLDFNK